MTWTLRAREASKLGAWLLFVSCLAACAGILGIEDRTEDTAGNYPLEGYDGCRVGDCDKCLAVHRQECETRSACDEASGQGECAACVCQNCVDPLVQCQQDASCMEIWKCLRDTRCDLSERAQANCTQSCGNVIQANGGISGHSFRAAAEIRTCATTSACLSCLAPQVIQSSPTCRQQDGCQECPSCFDQCLCSGERFGECQRLCGDDAPSSACNAADGCGGCGNCLEACTCNGGNYEACVTACTAPPDDNNPPTDLPAACTPDNFCIGCVGCAAQCECSGDGNKDQCTAFCAPPPSSDACREDPRGVASSCDGCQSPLSECTCKGTSIESCCADPNLQCYVGTYGSCDAYSSGSCDACACSTCPSEWGVCQDVDNPYGYDCQKIFDCMRASNCQGSACFDRCRADFSPEGYAYAEALWACYAGAECGSSCSTSQNQQPTIDCPTMQGTTQCAGYTTFDASYPACCNSTIITTLLEVGGGTVGGDDNPCGLDITRPFPSARICEPRDQKNPTRYDALETCPDRFAPSEAPYHGVVLKGCCRGADSTCGYYDDVMGLGCLSAGIFGENPQPCPIESP